MNEERLDNISCSNETFSAREIFDTLLAGKRVLVTAQCANDPDLVKLLNHLNVIKHRSRKIYESLGLGWENSVLKITPPMNKLTCNTQAILSLTLPVAAKKYAAFIILDNDESNKDNLDKE